MAAAALVVSVLAVLVSLGSAGYAAQVARRVGGSGFKAEEQLKADLVTLLAALRSIIVKGILAGQDGIFRSLAMELDVIRAFQVSTSGVAVSAWAAQRGHDGADEDRGAGRWRALSLNLGNLAGANLSEVAVDNARMQQLATDVELTLEDLGSQEVGDISRRIGDLATTFAALKEMRSNDIILRAWFEVYEERQRQSSPETLRLSLEALKSDGRQDPDIDFWLAVFADDLAGMKDAVERGADKTITVEEILTRYA